MNFAEELRLYEKVNKAASYFQVQLYNYKDNVWETSRGPLVVKTWERGDFNETREMAIELAKSGLIKVSLPYKGSDEGYLFDNTYYLVDQPQHRELDLTNLMDLERAAKFLASLHKLALLKRQENVLSVHIMPDTFFVTKFGELTLWGFENLRVENPYLSLAHLLYDCKSDSLRDFVLSKYEEINPLDRNALKTSEKLVWDSAIVLGQQGPRKPDVKLGIDKLQELVGMLWPLINMQEYTNVPVTEYIDTQEAHPVDVTMSDMNKITTSDYDEEEPTWNFDAQKDVEIGFKPEYQPEEMPVDEVTEDKDKEQIAPKEELKTEAIDEKPSETKKSEPLSWKPFPKLPNRRW